MKGDMQRYCRHCRRFSMIFMKSNEKTGKEGKCYGILFGVCEGEPGHLTTFGNSVTILADEKGLEVMDSMDSMRFSDVPKSLEPHAQEYSEEQESILDEDDMNCSFFVERNIEKWSSQE